MKSSYDMATDLIAVRGHDGATRYARVMERAAQTETSAGYWQLVAGYVNDAEG